MYRQNPFSTLSHCSICCDAASTFYVLQKLLLPRWVMAFNGHQAMGTLQVSISSASLVFYPIVAPQNFPLSWFLWHWFLLVFYLLLHLHFLCLSVFLYSSLKYEWSLEFCPQATSSFESTPCLNSGPSISLRINYKDIVTSLFPVHFFSLHWFQSHLYKMQI